MASRPAFTALGCLQCRNHVLRAITANSATFLRAPAVATTTTLRPRSLHRAFSSLPPETSNTTSEPSNQTPNEPNSQTSEVSAKNAEQPGEEKAGEQEDTPWFLQVEPPTHAPTQQVSPLPDLPNSPPALLEPLMKYVYEEMGLDDLSLLDLRALDPAPALGSNLLMLFATARSERHLHVSSSRLVKWLRHNHRIEANADGLIGPGELKTKLRRMKKKAKLLGSSAMVAKGGDDGISTGWICINLGTLGATYGEAPRFDAEGKLSGFGAPVTGASTIVVQVMTEARRTELNLERLWSQQLIRSEAQDRKLTEFDSEYHNRYGSLPTTTVRARRGFPANATQRRNFSTSLIRPATTVQQAPVEAADADLSTNASPATDSLSECRQRVEKIRWEGLQVSVQECLNLLRDIFLSTSTTETHSRDQADIAAQLIETMHERQMPIMDHETIITIIEAAVTSGAQGQGIRTIQSNMELILLQGIQSCPTEAQLLRLLKAYSIQGNWEKFWETWRVPTRYGMRRGPEMYKFVYSSFSQIGDKAKCVDALRKCVHEMLVEQPPVLPDNAVWPALKACLRIADPNAEHISEHMVSRGGQSTDSHKSANTEFVRMLKELEAVRKGI
ncbi:hypothetical protein EsH8_IX_000333 [Colletotrichum jinshuiense]